ncbi:hypothetical protein [Streptomyces sp. NPDC060010]|uniref:hypothetical protein n=1 Tax=Streptomyces sp. NPDC060010 TaxID=3347036 RepID=UPI0036C09EA4
MNNHSALVTAIAANIAGMKKEMKKKPYAAPAEEKPVTAPASISDCCIAASRVAGP